MKELIATIKKTQIVLKRGKEKLQELNEEKRLIVQRLENAKPEELDQLYEEIKKSLQNYNQLKDEMQLLAQNIKSVKQDICGQEKRG